MKTLRLLLFAACNRTCPGCCNNDWDLGELPRVDSYEGYDQIILTGGEPMLRPELVVCVAADIRSKVDAQIILYTARPGELPGVMPFLDGVTVTLHEQTDVAEFARLPVLPGSLRLNVFEGVDMAFVDTWGWKVKHGIKWIKDCPLPENEVFMRM